MNFLWYNIFLSFVLNWFVAPISYLFRKRCQKKKGFFWWFLSDKNMYGDKNWRKNLKSKFWRAYFWMLRNPLQNYYDIHKIEGKETAFRGTGKIKYGKDILSFRTVYCSDTDDNHGKIIDFKKSKFGTQDINFLRTDINNDVQLCYRKSKCIPFRFLWWIILWKWRSGHEDGLMQYSIAKPFYSYKKNKEGFKMWKEADWYLVTI